MSPFFYEIYFIHLDLIKLKILMIVRKNLFILIILVSNCFVGMILTESYYHSSLLEEVKKCLESKKDDKCKKMILLTERMQLREYYKGNLKCQTSLLGLQTELIRSFYFEGNKNNIIGKTIPSLIKNC